VTERQSSVLNRVSDKTSISKPPEEKGSKRFHDWIVTLFPTFVKLLAFLYHNKAKNQGEIAVFRKQFPTAEQKTAR